MPLKITIPEIELYDDEKNEFYSVKEQKLSLEHSLVSISKWESKWCKPFLSSDKTNEEFIDYIRCMTLTQNVDPMVYRAIPFSVMKSIYDYIEAPMTATTVSNSQKHGINNQIVTSELVYCWMTLLNIPFECQKWHFNRLIMLITVCSEENKPKKKMSKSQINSMYSSTNAKRRAAAAARRYK